MKTPRELLLERHRAANPKLDAIRRRLFATTPIGSEREYGFTRFAARCRAFFGIPRIAWAALLTTWAIIFALNVASSEAVPSRETGARKTAQRSPEITKALREQRRLLAELMGPGLIPE